MRGGTIVGAEGWWRCRTSDGVAAAAEVLKVPWKRVAQSSWRRSRSRRMETRVASRAEQGEHRAVFNEEEISGESSMRLPIPQLVNVF